MPGQGTSDKARLRARGKLTIEEAQELRVRTRQAFLALGMLVSGTANTISCKATLSAVSLGRPFNHPFVMSGCMFFGEILCLLWHQLLSSRSSSASSKVAKEAAAVPKHIFALPALCDILGTSVMYVGLTLTTASTYQMLRGSAIIFTGVLSATYLKRKQWTHHWVAMGSVFVGVITVGCASSLAAEAAPASAAATAAAATSGAGTRAVVGSLLVVVSQMFTAVQMCLEERFVTGYNLPALLAVGWEGVWGLAGVLSLLVGMQLAVANGSAPIEDSLFALRQLASNPSIVGLMMANALSIAFFNFFGMSITKTSSASYRMVLDSLRTLLVWCLDLALGGGRFHPMQLVGFAFMISGTAIYNEAVRLPCVRYASAAEQAEARDARAAQHERGRALLGAEITPSPPQPSPPPLPLTCPRPTASYAASPATPDLPLMHKQFFTPTLSRFTMQKN